MSTRTAANSERGRCNGLIGMARKNWFARHRLEWIAETLRVFGFINRDHLVRKFGISVPQASSDFKAFDRWQPGAMKYDLCGKCYRRQVGP